MNTPRDWFQPQVVRPALHDAVRRRDMTAVVSLVEPFGDQLFQRDYDDATPVELAIRGNWIEGVSYFADSPLVSAARWESMLRTATQHHAVDSAVVLLRRLNAVTTCVPFDTTALLFSACSRALRTNKHNTARREYHSDTDLSGDISGDYTVPTLEWLLIQGGDIHAQDEHGNTPLHHLILHNERGTLLHKNILYTISAFLRDANITNNDGNTPLLLTRNMTLIKSLVERGANLLHRNKRNQGVFDKELRNADDSVLNAPFFSLYLSLRQMFSFQQLQQRAIA